MTEEQKEILIAKMVDNPASLSADDIAKISGDEELRELYELSADMKSTFVELPEVDVDLEWRRFRRRMRVVRPHRRSWVMRVAAIFAGVALLSGVAVSLVNKLMLNNSEADMAVVKVDSVKPALKTENLMAEVVGEPAPAPKPTVRHGARRSVKKYAGPAEPSVEELVALQQARIDNEIALELAEAIKEQYIAVQEWDHLQTMMAVGGMEIDAALPVDDVEEINNLILQ